MRTPPALAFLSALCCFAGAALHASAAEPTDPAASPATSPAALATAPAAASPAPDSAAKPRYTYVLVHGAWAGGWEWKKVGNLLLQDGHVVYRPTLTGQGERVHLASKDVDLNTHIQDVVNTILFEDLHDVVLMGHSYGGMVITGVADRVPDRIKCLVYVDAMLPEDGESVNSFMGRKRPANPSADGFIPTPNGAPAPGQQPPYIVPMSEKIFETPETLKNPAAKKIPTTYILCVNKGVTLEKAPFYKSYQRALERGYFTETIESDHVVNQTHPTQLLPLLEKAPTDAKVNP